MTNYTPVEMVTFKHRNRRDDLWTYLYVQTTPDTDHYVQVWTGDAHADTEGVPLTRAEVITLRDFLNVLIDEGQR